MRKQVPPPSRQKRRNREDPPIITGGKGQGIFGGLKVSDANGGCSHTQGDWLPEFCSLFLGLDKLHNLTMGTPTRYEVRVDLQTANESAYAVYDSFQVASSKERYRLTVGKYRGTAGKTKCVLPAGVSCLVCLEDGSAPCHGPGGWNIVLRRCIVLIEQLRLTPCRGLNRIVKAIFDHHKIRTSVCYTLILYQ